MADETPAPKDKGTSSDDIQQDAPRRRRRESEDRISFLEDENDSLKKSVKTLEGTLNDLCKSLKSTPPRNPASGSDNFWEELSSALGL